MADNLFDLKNIPSLLTGLAHLQVAQQAEELNKTKIAESQMLMARLNQLTGQQQNFETLKSQYADLPYTMANPETKSLYTGPAKTDTGINIQDMIDSLLMKIPLGQFATARAEEARKGQLETEQKLTEAKVPGAMGESSLSLMKVKDTNDLRNLVTKMAGGTATEEDRATLRGVYAALGIDPKNIIPEAGTPAERTSYLTGLEKTRQEIKTSQAEAGKFGAEAGLKRAETGRITTLLPVEKARMEAETGKYKSESQKNQAEVDRIVAETGIKKTEALKPFIDSFTKSGMGTLTPEQTARMALNYTQSLMQSGNVGSALSSAMSTIIPPEKHQEFINNISKNPKMVIEQFPQITDKDSPIDHAAKVDEAKNVIYGFYHDPVRNMIQQRLGPKASEQQIEERTLMFLNSKIFPQYNPVRSENGTFLGFKSQFPQGTKGTRPPSIQKAPVIPEISDLLDEFFGKTGKIDPYSQGVGIERNR